MGNKSDKCPSCKYRIDPGGWAACDGCIHDEGLKDRYEPLTNADRIRAMSDEEMGTELLPLFEELCEDGIPSTDYMRFWLQQPAEEDT